VKKKRERKGEKKKKTTTIRQIGKSQLQEGRVKEFD